MKLTIVSFCFACVGSFFCTAPLLAEGATEIGFYIVGPVRDPGHYKIPSGAAFTIADALRSAGGALQRRTANGAPVASLRKVKVQRKLNGKQTTLVIDARPDSNDSKAFVVHSGDLIIVPTLYYSTLGLDN